MFPLFPISSRRGSKKSKTKSKAPKDNWYERLTVDELKSVCRAAQLPMKGTKKEMIDRLMHDEKTVTYGIEGKWIGATTDYLKRKCAERNLVQTGNKLTLVIRLIEAENGSNPDATKVATKRPAPQNFLETSVETTNTSVKRITISDASRDGQTV